MSRIGRILNLTSTMSHTSLPGRAVYSATKTGLLGLTRGLALELAPWNITVNGISPVPFATEMLQPVVDDAEMSREFLARIPLGRFSRPREVGRLAASLCSEDAGFITGTDILIDGGGRRYRPATLVRGRPEPWANCHTRKATWSETKPEGRWRGYHYDELVARDKASLDIFWLKDASLPESDDLPSPELIAQEIVEDLEAALEQFRLVATGLRATTAEG